MKYEYECKNKNKIYENTEIKVNENRNVKINGKIDIQINENRNIAMKISIHKDNKYEDNDAKELEKNVKST